MNRFTIGTWTVEPSRHLLMRGGESLRIEPRVMAVLVLLAERRGEVVSREELIERAWGHAPADEALTQAVSSLRRVLGEDARRFIETVPKRGYRLAENQNAESRKQKWAVAAVAAMVVVSIGGVGFRSEIRSEEPLRQIPVTAFAGREAQPAVSPDGTRIAFVWNGGRGANFQLYVTTPGGEPRRWTSGGRSISCPAWSPDGRRIAFVSWRGSDCAVEIMNRRVASCTSEETRVAWLRNEALIVSDGAPLALSILENGQRTPLTAPRDIHGDRFPAPSPDGREIAFIRTTTMGASDVWIVPSAGGSARRITHEEIAMAGLAWSAEDELTLSARRNGAFALWRVSLRDGRLSWIPADSENGVRPSRGGTLLAYEKQRFDSDLWIARTSDGRASRWYGSTRWESEPRVSPDGTRVAFISARDGSPQLWVADRGGANARRWTNIAADSVMTPRWSADGKLIAFAAAREVFVADGAHVTRITAGVAPSFTRDGRGLFFLSNRGGRWRVWRRELATSVDSIALDLPAGGVEELTNGDLIFNRMDRDGLWRARNGRMEKIAAGTCAAWSVAGDAAYFVDRARLMHVDLTSGAIATLSRLEADTLSVTPDGRDVLFAVADRGESDIVLLPNRSEGRQALGRTE